MMWLVMCAFVLCFVLLLTSSHLVLRAAAVKGLFDCLGVLLLVVGPGSVDLRLLSVVLIFTSLPVSLTLLIVSFERASRADRGCVE